MSEIKWPKPEQYKRTAHKTVSYKCSYCSVPHWYIVYELIKQCYAKDCGQICPNCYEIYVAIQQKESPMYTVDDIKRELNIYAKCNSISKSMAILRKYTTGNVSALTVSQYAPLIAELQGKPKSKPKIEYPSSDKFKIFEWFACSIVCSACDKSTNKFHKHDHNLKLCPECFIENVQDPAPKDKEVYDQLKKHPLLNGV